MLLFVACMGACLTYGRVFLPIHESRLDHVRLNDCVLNALPCIDFGRIISIMTIVGPSLYMLETLEISSSWYDAWRTIELFWFQFTLSIGFKTILLYSTPLAPPASYRPVSDVVTGWFSGNTVFACDLMFSGHTATMALCALNSVPHTSKVLFALLTVIMGILLMMQRVHYTADVIVGCMAALTCYDITLAILNVSNSAA